MDIENIKTLIDSLNRQEEVKIERVKNQFENARKTIQDFCPHPELKAIMIGNKCVICGKIVKYKDRCDRYILKEEGE